MEKINNINYMLVHEAFERDGWTMYHYLMRGNKWVKGNNTSTYPLCTSLSGFHRFPKTQKYSSSIIHFMYLCTLNYQALAPKGAAQGKPLTFNS